MKITVRIEDIEIIIDRPDYEESSLSYGGKVMEDTILPTIREACITAQILLNKKHEDKDFI